MLKTAEERARQLRNEFIDRYAPLAPDPLQFAEDLDAMNAANMALGCEIIFDRLTNTAYEAIAEGETVN